MKRVRNVAEFGENATLTFIYDLYEIIFYFTRNVTKNY